MTTITLYSYKGGVGRTLAVAGIAQLLAKRKFNVCLIDMDLEAPGLLFKFDGMDFEKKGVVDYVLSHINGTPPISIKEYFESVKAYSDDKHGHIHIMSAGAGLKNLNYWDNLAKINWDELFFSKDKNIGLSVFEELKEQIKNDIKPDYLIMDSRTGATVMSKVCTSVLPDMVFLLSINNEENIYGTKLMYDYLNSPESIKYKVNEKQSDVFCVLSRMLRQEDDEQSIMKIVDMFLTYIGDPKLGVSAVSVIETDNRIALDERNVKDSLGVYFSIALKLGRTFDYLQPPFQFISYDIASKVEEFLKYYYKEGFSESEHYNVERKIRKGNDMGHEDLYVLALLIRRKDKANATKAASCLYFALESDNETLEMKVCYLLGMILLYDLSNYREAEVCLAHVYKNSPGFDLNLSYDIAVCLFCLDRFEEALKYIDAYIGENKLDYRAYLLKANILMEMSRDIEEWTDERIEEILCYYNKAEKLNVNCPYIYNSRAYFYCKLGRKDKAQEEYSRAFEIAPKFYLTYYNNACDYFLCKKYEEALNLCNKAIENNPNYANSYYLRSKIYFELGNKQKGEDDMKKYDELISG